MSRPTGRPTERIALAEAKATAEVRNTAVDVAAARQVLAEQLDRQRKSKLIDDAIAELPKLLH